MKEKRRRRKKERKKERKDGRELKREEEEEEEEEEEKKSSSRLRRGKEVRAVGWTTAAVSNTRGLPVNYALCRGGFNIYYLQHQ